MINIQKEHALLQKYGHIVGIDEAGRGPWAGPVVIAGIGMTSTAPYVPGVNDSKKLSAKKRAELFTQLTQSHPYHIAIISSGEIDSLGIGEAVIKGIQSIVDHFQAPMALIDGYFRKGAINGQHECIIQGDAIYYCIAAASIIAKHTRDQIMLDLDKLYPQYNFKSHKGYGTKEHLALLTMHGASPVHRISYKPVKALL